MRFEFATATRIVAGPGTLPEAAAAARAVGRRALVVTGSNMARAKPLVTALQAQGVSHVPYSVRGEPTTDAIVAGVQQAQEQQCDLVVGFGGGSALDAAKAIAALLTNPGDLLDYLEVIGQAKPLTRRSAPCITIPTTAGTGTEVTRNAVLASPAHRVKVSLRSSLMLPVLAVVDPELSRDLPPSLTASTGMDALTQLIEPFVSIRANPFTDALCREGIGRVARSLRRAYEEPADTAAREDMAVASLFSGLALANAGLGAVHGFAGPIGGMFPAPHGAVCAALLAGTMEVNLRALRQRAPSAMALGRYDEIARLLTGSPQARSDDGVSWVRELCAALKIKPLATYGITAADIPVLCEKAAASSSMKGNPISLTGDEMERILQGAT